ncbi:Oxidoreductase domain-containing protein [Nitrosopumilaceae archaeon]|nr:Oxidoreductase domain-containing protein [Nitrosopumilaceae archaeon]
MAAAVKVNTPPGRTWKRLKILVLGCGSIGGRHARNAKSLGVADLVLVDPDLDRAARLAAELGTDLVYADYREAARKNPDLDAALICTPSSMHVKPAIFFARRRVSLFIEKPLSDGLAGVATLKRLRDENSLAVMMGHSFLFEEGFVKLGKLLEKKVVGDVHFAAYLQGQYLPDWHPEEDYRAEYAARGDLGGGALLTLASHSFYIIERMLGPVAAVRGAFVGRLGDLEVDVDDSAFMLLETEDGIPVQTMNNFITKVHQHRLIIEGTRGAIEQDFANKRITITLKGRRPRVISARADNNARFKREMRHFLEVLDGGRMRDGFHLEDGIRFLRIAKRARRIGGAGGDPA